MSDLLIALINASERAANVARACCERGLDEGGLLIAEKCESEANARFDHDFKTIADVLAQESAKFEIGSRYPSLSEHVRGEECSEINGVKICLEQNSAITAENLQRVVPENTAKRLAEAAHREPNLSLCDKLPKDIPCINSDELGVWIDPIDGTAEFISGVQGEAKPGRGLSCVTVLIGVYLKSTGEPILGVINQPFFNENKGRIIWGFSYKDCHKWGGSDMITDVSRNVVMMSSAEKPDIIGKFSNLGWEVKSVPGAGHKLLKVALGEAAAYIVSQGTTFRWDTCAPHAILRAKGGDIVDFMTREPITYNDPLNIDTQLYCNTGGLIAYTESDVISSITNILD